MNYFDYRDGRLCAEGVALTRIAERYGTPTYVYSRAALTEHFMAYQDALADRHHLICYAVKANSNLAVLNVLAQLGAGFDIVSVGELERVLAAGGDPAKVIFSGVGKQPSEMARALQVGIHCFNVESEAELAVLNRVAGESGKKANISLRVNPDVDAKTHPYISTGLRDNKFGIDISQALDVYLTANKMPHLTITGIDCHIGSQLTEIAPFIDALNRVLKLVEQLSANGIKLEHLDLGGGLGVCYQNEQPPHPSEYIAAIRQQLDQSPMMLVLEPGRSIAANAGILLTRVEYLKPGKDKNFAIVDAAMNDMIRPALYEAWMAIEPVSPHTGSPHHWDIVGPVCETGDFLGKNRRLSLEQGDLLCVYSAGAYGFTMSSNYNSRGRAAEIMVDGNRAHQVRARETVEDLIRGETLLPT
ncbi:diaminopimelate decarboxylase [Porticoccus hydrocarbonoclasticus]|jgi:diaminopimelate decarboxylase|uniref:diaminopimelate decarboxylase n=1 Tax=Porticoccus hydrocarbonoclasticus TaxID=1073414 RepID=UPI0023558C46|nr:diaminopimelate decarboxylase [Porticoccus hydrocarbonoclasticus]|tara:strand:+ start:90 stop:1337 length:1248 start_codon:yes stop_codon:yes gene_type:complete